MAGGVSRAGCLVRDYGVISYGRDTGYNHGSGQLRQDGVRIPGEVEGDIKEPRSYWRGQQE